MKDTKHSPGPWKAVIEYEELDGMRQDLCPRVEDAEGHCIVELWSSTQTITYFDQGTQEANARLIAKAPELLAWAKWAINELVEAWEEPEEKAIPAAYLAIIREAEGLEPKRMTAGQKRKAPRPR